MATKKTTDTEVKATKKAATKTTEAKATKAAKTTTKKAAEPKAAKAAKSAEVVLQFAGNQYVLDDIQAKIKDAWKNQFKKKVKDFTNVQIYIKPEDAKAYFVVNGDASTEYFVEL